MVTCDAQAWAIANFDAADLGDRRRGKRLTKLAAMMADAPDQSLPKQCRSWADLKAAYRLLGHPEITPEQITEPHRQQTRAVAEQSPIVLCVQDTTDLDYTHRTSVRGLGKIGDGGGRGFRQHTALALAPDGLLYGVLHQVWFVPPERPAGETRRQRQARWSEPDVWGQTARAIDRWPTSSRLIHVGDRHSDVFRFMCACRDVGHGFLVRAMHDRYLRDGDRLWDRLKRQRSHLIETVDIGAQRTRGNRLKRTARKATVSIRWTSVVLPPPRNDPRTASEPPVHTWAVYVREENTPTGDEPLEWMLLTSESLTDAADALRCVKWYQRRWIIEEWHRALKEGCRVERSQLNEVSSLQCLAAMSGVIAVRMLGLRNLADPASSTAGDPQSLQASAPAAWVQLVARLANTAPAALTPRAFLWTIARRGGYLARRSDPRPGWKVIWRGWYDIQRMVEGLELMRSPPRCG